METILKVLRNSYIIKKVWVHVREIGLIEESLKRPERVPVEQEIRFIYHQARRYDDWFDLEIMVINKHFGLIGDRLQRNKPLNVTLKGLNEFIKKVRDVVLFDMVYSKYNYLFYGDIIMGSACRGGVMHIVKVLLEQASPTLPRTLCIREAVIGGNVQVLEYLHSIGVQDDGDRSSLVTLAIGHNDHHMLAALVRLYGHEIIPNRLPTSSSIKGNCLVGGDLLFIKSLFCVGALKQLFGYYSKGYSRQHSATKQLEVYTKLFGEVQGQYLSIDTSKLSQIQQDKIKLHGIGLASLEDLVRDGSNEMIDVAMDFTMQDEQKVAMSICRAGTVEQMLHLDKLAKKVVLAECMAWALSNAIVVSNSQIINHIIITHASLPPNRRRPLVAEPASQPVPRLSLETIKLIHSINGNFGLIFKYVLRLDRNSLDFIIDHTATPSPELFLAIIKTTDLALFDRCVAKYGGLHSDPVLQLLFEFGRDEMIDRALDDQAVVQFLKSNRPDFANWTTRIGESGNIQLVDRLLTLWNPKDIKFEKLFRPAIAHGRLDFIKHLIQHHGARPAYLFKTLLLAIQFNHCQIIEFLLDVAIPFVQPDINNPDNVKHWMESAITRGQLEPLNYLISKFFQTSNPPEQTIPQFIQRFTTQNININIPYHLKLSN